MSEKVHTNAAAYNTQPNGLEKWLDGQNKKFPLQLPVGGKKWLSENAWWLVLIGGLLSLWGAWSYWQIANYASSVERWTNELGRVYGVDTAGSTLGVTWYLALAALLAGAILLLLAISPLKQQKKQGWNLVFYSALLSLVVGVIYLFVPGYGAGSLVGMLIGALLSWFFLFQVRSYYVK